MKKNPLTMRGALGDCWLFSFRAPIERLRPLVPAPLQVIVRDGFGFWNVVVCRVQQLRPAPLPAFCGMGYWHVAYRICVTARLASGQSVEGLFFVHNECDSPLVAGPGALLSGFQFQPVRVEVTKTPGAVAVQIASSKGGVARFSLAPEQAPELAGGALFGSLTEAVAFLKYQPCALFPSRPGAIELLRVSRDESRWRSRAVHVESSEWPFLKSQEATLELCSEVAPINYQWNRGEILEVAV